MTSPEDEQATIVRASTVDTVIVDRESSSARAVIPAEEAEEVSLFAHILAKVVYQTGTVVVAAGPHVYVSTAAVAPAAAPRAMVYSAAAANLQPFSSALVVPLTCRAKSATYANMTASRPELRNSLLRTSNPAPEGESISNPKLASKIRISLNRPFSTLNHHWKELERPPRPM